MDRKKLKAGVLSKLNIKIIINKKFSFNLKKKNK